MALACWRSPTGVHAVNLKNRLRDIETDRANLAHGRLPSSGSFRRNHPMATLLRRPQHQTRPCGPAYMPLNFRSSPKADIVSRHWLLTFVPITELRQPIATTSRFCYTSRLASLCSLHSAWGPHASGASTVGFAVLISTHHRALAFVPPRASGSMKGEQSAMIASRLDGKHRTATSSPVQRLAFDLRNSEFSDPIPRKTMAGCTRPDTSIKC
jgi:hypothetical protein